MLDADGDNVLRPKGEFSTGLRTGKMNDNFFTKGMQYITFAMRQDHGKRFCIHQHETDADVEI